MASYKHIAFLAVILAVLATNVKGTSLVVGARQANDALACYGDVHLLAEPGKVVSATRVCKVPNPRQLISFISVKYQGSLGRGGYVQITSGGLYQETVTISLYSQSGQPLDFSLNVFAIVY